MTAAAAPAPKVPSVWEDFVDIFVSPAQVFARRRGNGFFLPLLVLTVIVAALGIGTRSLTAPITDAVMEKQMAVARQKNPQMTDAQAAKARQVGGVFATVAVVIGVPIAVLVTGLVFWLVSLPFDAKWRIADSMMVATYAAFPRIFSFVAAALIAAFSDPATLTSPYVISPGPAHFVAPGSVPAALLALLGRLDVFTIWATILLGLGLHIAGKVPKGRAFAAAAVMWVLGSLPLIYQGMKLG